MDPLPALWRIDSSKSPFSASRLHPVFFDIFLLKRHGPPWFIPEVDEQAKVCVLTAMPMEKLGDAARPLATGAALAGCQQLG